MQPKRHFMEQYDPDRKDFQLDRLILFSDALFAIAITLLIIEIVPPTIKNGYTDSQILTDLYGLTKNFIGFIVSFFVIALYWRSHHRTFGFVSKYSERLISLNIFFLFTIVLMPFSTAYYSENFRYGIPFYFYTVNIILTGIANMALVTHIFKPANGFVKHYPTAEYLNLFKARAIIHRRCFC